MKSNKGFTLIELLAVIVILAIIALIATPTILGVIETARKGAAESSALGYIDAVEKQIAIDMLEAEKSATGSYGLAGANGDLVITSEGKITVDTKDVAVNLKGTPAQGGKIRISTTGEVSKGCLKIVSSGKTYHVSYNGSSADAILDGEENACSFDTLS